MQELHASNGNFSTRETVSDFILFPPSCVGAGASVAFAPSVCNKKNGLNGENIDSNHDDTANPSGSFNSCSKQILPTLNDAESTINDYLQRAFPSYTNEVFSFVLHEPIAYDLEYSLFPTFKTTYCNVNNQTISYKSGRPEWEPYKWFFSQIRWTNTSENHSITYCELAIAAHIMTGGATAPSQDLCTKTKLITSAMKKYFHKKILPNKVTYKDFFKPHNSISTVAVLGADVMPGVQRRPIFKDAPHLFKQIRSTIWKAAQEWQTTNCATKFGESFIIKGSFVPVWQPDSVVWLYKTMEENKQSRLCPSAIINKTNIDSQRAPKCNRDSSYIVSGLSPVSAPASDVNKNGSDKIKPKSTDAKQHICFYGHTTTSSYRRGKPVWHVSPLPPWPSVPPDRPLCQRCYLVHRTAALKGKSQYSFPHLFLYQKQNINPPNTGGASSSASTERPPG